MLELLKGERQGDSRAELAVEMFCYRVRKYIGAYLAFLGVADALIFGGGIGKNPSDSKISHLCGYGIVPASAGR